jgi:dehydrogenase/reductase SDR family protein 7B
MAASVSQVQAQLGTKSVDILIHNGGVSTRALAENMAWEVDESVLKVNYLGPVALTKAVLPGMLSRDSGHLVVISSVQGLIGLPARTAYSASKHALHGFFDGLRAELASRNVAVSLICPGYVRTSLSLNAVNAAGGKYGQMDETTAKGMLPQKFAALALEAIARKDAQIVIADDLSAHVGVYLKWLCPHVLEWVMRKRAKKAV